MEIVKISELSELTNIANGDLIPIVDISEPLDINKTKYIKKQNLITPVRQTIELMLADETDQVTTDLVGYFFVPSSMNNMVLSRAQAFLLTAGMTNATTVQIRNLTKYPSNDSLLTAISIASGTTVGIPGVVNSSYDDISTNDKLKISVSSVSTIKPYGLAVVMEYIMP